jgi:hypothetical protein
MRSRVQGVEGSSEGRHQELSLTLESLSLEPFEEGELYV